MNRSSSSPSEAPWWAAPLATLLVAIAAKLGEKIAERLDKLMDQPKPEEPKAEVKLASRWETI